MKKRVKISELKAHLSEYLRHVRRGLTVEVFDRETLIAEIVPVETRNGLEVRPATGSMRDFVPPPPLKTKVDVVALLREDRDSR
jgi:antitoxin (DNA-binding transcriptional repressor) of toxin-antitoxin stability system